jgi:hypothetical protein
MRRLDFKPQSWIARIDTSFSVASMRPTCLLPPLRYLPSAPLNSSSRLTPSLVASATKIITVGL